MCDMTDCGALCYSAQCAQDLRDRSIVCMFGHVDCSSRRPAWLRIGRRWLSRGPKPCQPWRPRARSAPCSRGERFQYPVDFGSGRGHLMPTCTWPLFLRGVQLCVPLSSILALLLAHLPGVSEKGACARPELRGLGQVAVGLAQASAQSLATPDPPAERSSSGSQSVVSSNGTAIPLPNADVVGEEIPLVGGGCEVMCTKCKVDVKDEKYTAWGHSSASAKTMWCGKCINNYAALAKRPNTSRSLKAWWAKKFAEEQVEWFRARRDDKADSTYWGSLEGEQEDYMGHPRDVNDSDIFRPFVKRAVGLNTINPMMTPAQLEDAWDKALMDAPAEDKLFTRGQWCLRDWAGSVVHTRQTQASKASVKQRKVSHTAEDVDEVQTSASDSLSNASDFFDSFSTATASPSTTQVPSHVMKSSSMTELLSAGVPECLSATMRQDLSQQDIAPLERNERERSRSSKRSSWRGNSRRMARRWTTRTPTSLAMHRG